MSGKLRCAVGTVLVFVVITAVTSCPDLFGNNDKTDTPVAGGDEFDELPVVDLPVATGLSFIDIDLGPGEICGDLVIAGASDESAITHYRMYWGGTASSKLSGSTALAEVEATGGEIRHYIQPDTLIPAGATHFLVYARNAEGIAREPASTPVVDVVGTTYSGSEGSAAAPVELTAISGDFGSEEREIGKGRSYYSLSGTYNFRSVSISRLTDDVDLIFYGTDSIFTSVHEDTQYHGRRQEEAISFGGINGTVYFVIDGGDTGYKLNSPGAAFTLEWEQHGGSDAGDPPNEGTLVAPEIFSQGYRGSASVGDTSYYEVPVVAGTKYWVNANPAVTVTTYTDQFNTTSTLPLTALGASLFIRVVGSTAYFEMEIVTDEGDQIRPEYLKPNKTNFCWVGDGSSYYLYEVTPGVSYTATLEEISFSNNVSMQLFQGSDFTSSVGGTTITPTSTTVGIRVDDVTGNGASFQLTLAQ